MTDEQHGYNYELSMPLRVVASVGGIFDDKSFTAGWQCAQIDYEISVWTPYPFRFVIYSDLIEQVDLIAMRRECTFTVVSDDGEWANVEIRYPLVETERD